MTITMLAGLLLLGVFSGFMAGLLGVGGGMILVPFLIYIFGLQNMFGMVSIKFAIASAMAVICFTSLSSARAHAAARAVNWRLVFIFALGILPGGLLASVAFFSVLRAQGLYFVFSGFVLLSAFSMWRGSEAKTRKKLSGRDINKQDPRLLAAADFQRLPAKPWLVLFGAVVGCVSGLVGAGGGFLTVPFQTRFGVPVNRAVATSAAT
ncbi:MAG: sulfite exporter TauE/SafE family protein, partial [Alphaproteobacteria bacterium]|nr:sulfite exporter TauE/SafE family protein [Alphaproteobacteria bacterium]